MQETRETLVQSLGREDPLEEGTATHSSILAWRILWTEEPDGQTIVCGVPKSQTQQVIQTHTGSDLQMTDPHRKKNKYQLPGKEPLLGSCKPKKFPDLRLPVKPPFSSLRTVYPQQPSRVSEVLISSPSGICTLFSQLRMCFLLLSTDKFLSKIFISLNVTIRQ